MDDRQSALYIEGRRRLSREFRRLSSLETLDEPVTPATPPSARRRARHVVECYQDLERDLGVKIPRHIETIMMKGKISKWELKHLKC